MTAEILPLLKKSAHAIKVSEKLLAEGFPSDVASKIYYAMFYAAQALLKSKNIYVVKHSAVESVLGFHFVKQEKLDAKYHRAFLDARKLREYADYDIQERIVRPQVEVKIQEAKVFLKIIKKMIKG